jgi:outer membrane protein OmpA-like peptidoglycan-associated protein/flagellar hook assembly protein FlgD
MRKLWASGLSVLFVFCINTVFAIQDGSQWIYTGYSPSLSGMGYTGSAGLKYASGIFANPANPAFARRLRVFGGIGITPPNNLIDIGITYPNPYGVFSAVFKHVYFNHEASVNSAMDFKVGFAKMIEDYFAFGADIYFVNQAKVGTGADFGIGLDLGAVIRLKDPSTDSPLALRNNRVGIALTGLGKPASVEDTTYIPGLGTRFGFSSDFLDFGKPFRMGFQSDLAMHFLPFNIFANVGLKMTLAEHFSLMGGIIAGNNGIGVFSGDGMSAFSFGASFFWQFNETPIEIFYSYNPYSFEGVSSAVHFVGVEIAFGLLDETPPENALIFKDNTGGNFHSANTDNKIYFSPNYDGSQDTVEINPGIRDMSQIKDWELKIINSRGETVRTFYGRERLDERLTFKRFWQRLVEKKEAVPIPDKIVWNGTSDAGMVLPDGEYGAFLISTDEYDNTGTSPTNKIILDTNPPSFKLGIDYLIFSPDDDGIRDKVTITMDLSEGDFWRWEIRNSEGRTIADWEWTTNPPAVFVWDGRDRRGNIAPDGAYDFLVYGRDRAGNREMGIIKDIIISTIPYSVFLASQRSGFSPNDDGTYDEMVFLPTFSDTDGLVEWKLDVLDTKKRIVRNFAGKTDAPEKIVWDGKGNEGIRLSDGDYLAVFSAVFENGANPYSQTNRVVLDTTPPSVDFSYSPELFSPDDDGENDILTISLKIEDKSGIESWKLEIFDPDGLPFKRFAGMGQPAPSILWDGRSDTGELVESATDYAVKITATDNYGNTVVKDAGKIPIDILVERTDRGLKIQISSIEFQTGSANLTEQAIPILRRLTQILRRYDAYNIEIQGHTDNVGSEQLNLRLSKERAESVKRWLSRNGIRERRMTTSGMAFHYPVADNETPEGRRRNRRVEFLLIRQP